MAETLPCYCNPLTATIHINTTYKHYAMKRIYFGFPNGSSIRTGALRQAVGQHCRNFVLLNVSKVKTRARSESSIYVAL